MADNEKNKVLGAFQLVLRPIVKILLRYGIGYNEFAEVVKTAFVDVSTTEFGIRGRPTNISRVAVMTGLTRKEVRRLRNKLELGDGSVTVKSTPMTEILHRWYSDSDFLDQHGIPRSLPFTDGMNSFSELVKRYGGDVPPGAMRAELKRVGCISEDGSGVLTVEQRSFWPSDNVGKVESALVHHVYPLVSAVAHNTTLDGLREPDAFPQYAAYSLNIAPSDKARLKRICRDRIANLAESFDDLFISNESSVIDGAPVDSKPIMVGLYYFEETDQNANYKW
jgi:hypothetical protein